MIRVREMDIEFCRYYFNALEAARPPAWRYNEMKPCGLNYNNILLAWVYDAHHQQFRDYRREAERIVAMLGLGASATVIDMGCGTGGFALHAARRYRKVHAVDVSGAMLRLARRKARRAGLSNIEFHRGGFLTYEHEAEPADAIVSVAALHHLPDFWKLVGLHRLASMLKPNGRLYLFDVVFSFDAAQYESGVKRFIRRTRMQMGPSGEMESETHCRQEYSTCDWIMEGLLERAGFEITKTDRQSEFLADYLCTKRIEAPCIAELNA
jgi:putative AdoMet-dependent methyltransferase